MTTLWYLGLALLPAFAQRWLRNLAGAQIASGARVSWLSYVAVRDLRMEAGARIGPLTVIKGPSTVVLGRRARIDGMVLVNCRPGPGARLTVGSRSRVMSFSVLEPSEGITIGEETGLGGQCLIFCHGSWPNYLEGAPYARGPVRIGDEVWIPWRVMILPNCSIPDRAVIGAHSLVRGELEHPGALYSGVPARLVVEEIWREPDAEERGRRLQEVLESFGALDGALPPVVTPSEAEAGATELRGTFVCALEGPIEASVASAFARGGANVFDFPARRASVADARGRRFLDHLETYGIRLDPDAG
jgi:acetyltransferase-like isoleucine patch superfamily enzyme